MNSKKQKLNPFKRIIRRYRQIPEQLRSRKVSVRSKAQRLIALTVCIPVMIYSAGYFIYYQKNRTRIEQENAEYRAMYTPQTAAPTAVPTAELTVSPTETFPSLPFIPHSTPDPTHPAVQDVTLPAATQAPPPDAVRTDPMPQFEIAPDFTLSPYGTPDADTVIYALETPSPIQESFSGLLETNPDTVGYLTVGDVVSLPVVQRANDNSYYLNHNFEGEESNAGTLFLDGANLLVPEDSNLIVYGHNMKNGTMFNHLSRYGDLEFLKENPIVYFDTIYKNRSYVPFAVFTASMDTGRASYLNIRQFVFDDISFQLFADKIEYLSTVDIPVDAEFGDDILLLVTCEYTHDNGRFIVALRALREGETEDGIRETMKLAVLK